MQPFPVELETVLGAVAQCAPAAALRARGAMRALLQPILQSAWPDVAWCAGTLTGDGFPVEVSCGSESDEEIRYAVEGAAPEWSDHARLDAAVELLRSVGAAAVDPVRVTQYRDMQSGRSLRYGAFVGGRHDASSDRFKLYVEVPDGCTPSSMPRVDGVVATPVMVGCEPGAGRDEFYFRVSGPVLTSHLSAIASCAGVAHRTDELLSLVGDVWGRPVHQCLPGTTVGFSITRSGSQRGGLAIFNYASSLFVTDGGVRHRVLSVASARHWPCRQYELLTRCFEGHQPATMAHTMFTCSVTESGPAAFRVGLRPVA